MVFYGASALGNLSISILGVFQRPDYFFENEYIVDVKGRVLQKINSRDTTSKYLDLAGHPVNDPELTRNAYQSQISFASVSAYIGAPHGIRREPLDLGYRAAETYVTRGTDVPQESWYYLIRERYFVGYKTFGLSRIGSIGQDGFQPGFKPVQPFVQPMESDQYWQIPLFFQMGGDVDYADFDARRITPIFSDPHIFGVSPAFLVSK